MADILIVCVREDESQAKALADMFERAGFSVGGAPNNDAALRSSGAAVVVWSQASIRSRPFLDAAQRVVNANKAVLACLIAPPPAASVKDAPSFDLTDWTGDPDDPLLDPLFFAVDRQVNAGRGKAGAPQPAAASAASAFDDQDYDAPNQDREFERPAPSARGGRTQPPAAPPYARQSRTSRQDTSRSEQPNLPPGFQMRGPQSRPEARPESRPAPRHEPRHEARSAPPEPYREQPPAPRTPPRNAPPPRSALTTPAYDPVSDEATHWRAIRNSNDPEAFLDYLTKHGPDGTFSELAQLRLRQLEAAQTPNPPPEPPPEARGYEQEQHVAPYQPQMPERRPAQPDYSEPDPDSFTFGEPPAPSRREARMESRPRRPAASAPGYERDFRDVVPVDPPKTGGGFIRMFVLLILLLGVGAAGAVYLGYGDKFMAFIDGGEVADSGADGSYDDYSDLGASRSADAEQAAGAESSGDISATPLAEVVDPSPTASDRQSSRTQTSEPARSQPSAARQSTPTPPPRTNTQSSASNDSFNPRAGGPASLAPPSSNSNSETSAADLTAAASPFAGFSYPGAQSGAQPSAPVSLSPSSASTPETTPAPAPQGAVVWARRPSAQSIGRLFPRQALRDSRNGYVTLECSVRADMALSCTIASESPTGFGFGRAALEAVDDYRARPTLTDGASAVGASTRISINFRAPR